MREIPGSIQKFYELNSIKGDISLDIHLTEEGCIARFDYKQARFNDYVVRLILFEFLL